MKKCAKLIIVELQVSELLRKVVYQLYQVYWLMFSNFDYTYNIALFSFVPRHKADGLL